MRAVWGQAIIQGADYEAVAAIQTWGCQKVAQGLPPEIKELLAEGNEVVTSSWIGLSGS